jgi:hypothetical protein
MSVTAQTPYKNYTAAPGATLFTTDFRLLLASDLVVKVNGAVVATGFTVSGIGAASADVTFGTPRVGGEIIELQRSVPKTRATDYQQLGDYQASAVNADFDRIVMMLQDVQFDSDLAVSLPVNDAAAPMTLPSVAARASRFLAFDASGNAIAAVGASSVPVSAFMATVLDDLTAAAARTTLGAVGLTGNETIAGVKTFSEPVLAQDHMAVGRNWDNLAQGLQIGGGDTSYGTDGNVFAPDGHSSWTRIQPSRNESSIELLVYPSASQGRATATIGTNQVARVSGTAFTAAWVGRKFYLGEVVYRVLAVADATNLTVTTEGGGAVSFASTFTETYHVFSVQGSGLCSVSGNTVARVSGDPFVVFLGPTNPFTIDGSSVTVSSVTNIDTLTISTSLSLTNVPYTFSLDINDQIAAFRLQKMIGSDEENLSIYARYDGYWVHSLFAGAGGYRKIVIGAGERQASVLARQVVTQKNGDLCLGGDYDNDAVRILNQTEIATNRFQTQGAPSGFGPAWAVRGVDTNVDAGIDMKGVGGLVITQDFSRILFKVLGAASTVNRLTIVASVTGNPVVFAVDSESADANVDILLSPKGTGVIRMGAWTSNVDGPINGYITIKDSAGNTRKIPTIA